MRAALQVTRVGTRSFLFVQGQSLSLCLSIVGLRLGFFPEEEDVGSGKNCLDSSSMQCKEWQRCRQWRGRPFSHPLPGLAVGHTSFAIFLFVRQHPQSPVLFFV